MFKKQARKGQCFSTTKKLDELSESDITTIPDIIREGFNFTDGCGFISREYAAELSKRLDRYDLSALQIRLMGAKGMLMVNPDPMSHKIALRESQKKFESKNYNFEICGINKFSQGYLNC